MQIDSTPEITPAEPVGDDPSIVVRLMRQDDLDAVALIDEASSGRRRPRYFELLLQRALAQPAMQVSLVAEHREPGASRAPRSVVGFIVASLYYGEYGLLEPSASIDAVGVAKPMQGRGVGHALMRQLLLNVGALRIESVRTEVAWDDLDMLAFLRREGFGPSGRLSLERRL